MASLTFTGAGSIISDYYFVADLATMGVSYLVTGNATSIGDYLDNATNGGVIINKNDFN